MKKKKERDLMSKHVVYYTVQKLNTTYLHIFIHTLSQTQYLLVDFTYSLRFALTLIDLAQEQRQIMKRK